jgi:hypothetical protein
VAEHDRGIPQGEITAQHTAQREAENAGANLPALFMQEQQGGKERSYEELVSLIKSAVEKERDDSETTRLTLYCG